MHKFPLNPFLESIKDEIPICVRDYERMLLVLQGEDVWTIERLRDVLLALLVKNRIQQNKFLRRFDAFFSPDAQTVLDDQEIKRVLDNIKVLIEIPNQSKQQEMLSQKTVNVGRKKVASRLKWWIIFMALTILMFLFGIRYFYSKPSLLSDPQSSIATIELGNTKFVPVKNEESESNTISFKKKEHVFDNFKGNKIIGSPLEKSNTEMTNLHNQQIENQNAEQQKTNLPVSDRIQASFLDHHLNLNEPQSSSTTIETDDTNFVPLKKEKTASHTISLKSKEHEFNNFKGNKNIRAPLENFNTEMTNLAAQQIKNKNSDQHQKTNLSVSDRIQTPFLDVQTNIKAGLGNSNSLEKKGRDIANIEGEENINSPAEKLNTEMIPLLAQVIENQQVALSKTNLTVFDKIYTAFSDDQSKTKDSTEESKSLKNKKGGIEKFEGNVIINAPEEKVNTEMALFPDQVTVNQYVALTKTNLQVIEGKHTELSDYQHVTKKISVRAILNGQAEADKITHVIAKRLYRNMPFVEKIEYYPLPEKSKNWIYYGCFAMFFLLAIIYYCDRLRRSCKIPEDQPAIFDPNNPNRHFSMAAVGGKRPTFLTEEILDHLADCMGYFQNEQIDHKIDIDESVKSTVKKNGITQIVFSKRKQTRTLLVLKDNFAESPRWNSIASELVNGIQKRGVPVIYGRFDCSFDQFKTDDGSIHYMDDLEDQRNGYLVLIFAEIQGKISQHLIFAMERLSRWPMKAWMDYQLDHCHDDSIKHLQKINIPVFPASSEGVYNAIRQYLAEQGVGKDLSKIQYRHFSAGIIERPSVLVEYLLGDALSWAQDCSMIQPVSIGLADTIRKKFHHHLPPERMARIISLPDTVNTSSGLRFSVNILALLRTGFIERRSSYEQEVVLSFLMDEIKKAEPAIEKNKTVPGLDHLKWEATLERLRMELEKNNDLERFASLVKSPLLGPGIIAELESYDFNGNEGKIPLRFKPENPMALQRLANLPGNPFQINKLKAFSIKQRQWLALVMLTLAFFALAGKCGINYLESKKNIIFFEITKTLLLNGRLDRKTENRWEIVDYWKGKPSNNRLAGNSEYRIILYDNGYRTIKKFKTHSNQRIRIKIKRKNKSCKCKEEFPEIGLTVLRCKPNTPSEEPLEMKTWKEVLGDKAPIARSMSIGLEFLEEQNEENPSLDSLRNTLLNTRSVDILYQILPDNNGIWNLEALTQTIQADIMPWFYNSQMIWWQTGDYVAFSQSKNDQFLFGKKYSPHVPQTIRWSATTYVTFSNSKFDRVINLNIDKTNLSIELEKIFKPGVNIVVTEKELLDSMGYFEPVGKGPEIVMIRDLLISEKTEFSLTVKTKPDDATVRLMNIRPKYKDGIKLKPGKYDVEVSKEGFHTYRRWFTIEKKDKTIEVNLNIIPEKNKFSFTVKTKPVDATVRLMNIKPRYKDGIKLKPGKYDVEVSKKGFHIYRKWFTLEKRDKIIEINLNK